MSRSIRVLAQWDPEASVWTAFSDDLPGLVSESATMETLIERVRAVVPELLSLAEDGDGRGMSGVRVVFKAEREELID